MTPIKASPLPQNETFRNGQNEPKCPLYASHVAAGVTSMYSILELVIPTFNDCLKAAFYRCCRSKRRFVSNPEKIETNTHNSTAPSYFDYTLRCVAPEDAWTSLTKPTWWLIKSELICRWFISLHIPHHGSPMLRSSVCNRYCISEK